MDTEPKPLVVKVTVSDDHCYYVHFQRDTQDLLAVYEYKKIYTPRMGKAAPKTTIAINTAKAKIGKPFKTTMGELT